MVDFDLTPLKKAILRLEEGLIRYQEDISGIQIRDGLVQRFEFTYEISHKILKRYLEKTSANPDEFDEMTFQNIIRLGNEKNLLMRDWTHWRKFRDMRSRTSHTYDEETAIQVVSGIPEFLQEAKFLQKALQEKLDAYHF